MLLAWVETEEDLTAIHNAAKVPIFEIFNIQKVANIVFMMWHLSEHERLLDHSQSGVCQRVLEERADPGAFLKGSPRWVFKEFTQVHFKELNTVASNINS